MYCIKCGKKLEESDKFCDHCGQRISESEVNTKETNKIDLSRSVVAKEFNFKKEFFKLFLIFALLVLLFYPETQTDFSEKLYASIFLGGIIALVLTFILDKFTWSPSKHYKYRLAKLFILVIGISLFLGSLTSNVCNLPVKFSVGKIDERFGLSKEELSEIIKNSSERWNTASQNKLFAYDENASISVNLIYDKRQKKLDNIKKFNQSLETFEEEAKQHENSVFAYNNDTDIWNSSNRLSQAEYKRSNLLKGELEIKRKELEERADALQKEANSLNFSAIIDNLKLNNYKDLRDSTNKEIWKLAQGLYIEDTNTGKKEINLYAFEKKDDLLLVLMHEMGHSLGIRDGEATKANSIMYYIDTGTQDSRPTPEDVGIVNKKCGQRSFFNKFLDKLTISSP